MLLFQSDIDMPANVSWLLWSVILTLSLIPEYFGKYSDILMDKRDGQKYINPTQVVINWVFQLFLDFTNFIPKVVAINGDCTEVVNEYKYLGQPHCL